jgi:hypothetical protein
VAAQMASLEENAEPVVKSGKGRQILVHCIEHYIPGQTIGSHE